MGGAKDLNSPECRIIDDGRLGMHDLDLRRAKANRGL